jgi:hypothetical protein
LIGFADLSSLKSRFRSASGGALSVAGFASAGVVV